MNEGIETSFTVSLRPVDRQQVSDCHQRIEDAWHQQPNTTRQALTTLVQNALLHLAEFPDSWLPVSLQETDGFFRFEVQFQFDHIDPDIVNQGLLRAQREHQERLYLERLARAHP